MTVGIDFGTSTSEIACIIDGKPSLIPNRLGEFITPSAVYINEDGTPLVGREAADRALLEPGNTFLEVKRLLGKNTTLTARGKVFYPVDIASMIIKYLADCARDFTGTEADTAVITVPAYFNDAQRREVIEAGGKAGLKVKRIINEPTAASLDYGIGHLTDCCHVLVYDFGGGTLDVTVLELFEGVVDVKASCGNNALGGRDFDEAITEHIAGQIFLRDGMDIHGDARGHIRVKTMAEQCKIALSEADEFEAVLPFLYQKNGLPMGFSQVIPRAAFEDMIRDKVYSTAGQIKAALFDARLSPKDIGFVLPVGGSTQIPLVTRFLTELFGFEPKALVDPHLSVVRGAAVQAGVLSGGLKPNAIVLTDVCPYSLSTEVLRSAFDDKTVCDVLIRRNTTLPATVSKPYYTAEDYQQTVIVSVYQGEGLYPAENYLINKFYLGGIPKAKAGREQILVTFSFDLNSILTVSAEVVSTGKSASVTVDTMAGRHDLSQWKNAGKASAYRRLIARAEEAAGTEEISAALDDLKKGILLDWADFILEELAGGLEAELEDG